MDTPSRGFIILVILVILLAGFLTWNIVSPNQAGKFYEYAFGIKPASSEALGKATIQFKKTEE